MRKIINMRALLSIMLVISFIGIMNPVTVYAKADAEVQAVANEYAPGGTANKDGTDWPADLRGYFTTIATEGYDKVSVGGTNYYYNPSNKENIINAGNSTKGEAQIQGTITELDPFESGGQFEIKADVNGAAELMSGFRGSLNTFLGILVTLITLGMTVFTGLDLIYIAFPVVRGKINEKKEEGKFKHIITEDARYAVVKADVENTGQNAFILYGKKRIASFVVLSILLFILSTGNINILTNIGVKLASGVLKALNNTF